ncbi:radical SAM protein [Hymenobacter sp. 5516J-16]|uniref:radical SAM protein n=1 Tax=Hymenobacter sp. 5516J-16 TaxID=2932253 RepID=UPI00293F67A3|nr:radical SAM protein [Hymenobacter sp. 5516J-16]
MASDAEITLEANPDDLTSAKVRELAASPVNRLSIGLQSFHEPHLRLMNRAHSAQESRAGVLRAQDAGFENISVDLIYGVPAPTHALWEADMAAAFALNVPHLSCYALTIEPDTVFGRQLKKGKFAAPPMSSWPGNLKCCFWKWRAMATNSTKSATSAGPAASRATTRPTGAGCPTWAGPERPLLQRLQPAVHGS